MTPQQMIRTLATMSFLLLAIALYVQHLMGILPCQMCLWQRVPHFFVVGMGILAMMPFLSPYHRFILILMGGGLLGAAGIAFWHSGVELGLLTGPSACSASLILDGDPAELLEQILAAPSVPRCDAVVWSFFKLSMANWHFVIALLMGLSAFFVKSSETPHD